MKREVAVWDTYVTRKDGKIMHFDIVVPKGLEDEEVIYGFGREYLKTKGEEGQPLTSRESTFCHFEAVRPEWEASLADKGHYIVEMENCL